jgi:cellulose synthase/poly-beta-1,6-N-acetylglucosamine synthase-like glycosyltransferase
MTMIDVITIGLCLFSLLYILSSLYLLRQRHPEQQNSKSNRRVNVLIAARNEERNLRNCLLSLTKQDYPHELYHVTILDDDSQDATAEIARYFCKTQTNFHYKHIKNTIGNLKGKMNALAQGLADLEGDIVLITDADCIVPPTWIKTMVSYFDKSTGLIGALTSLTPLQWTKAPVKDTLFHKIQTLDWFFLQAVARLSSNAGKAVTVLGNNFGFSLQAYRETGGFEEMGFSITEDYALMRAIERIGSWSIKHINDPNAAIFSYPLDNLKGFILQRLRWIKGGKSARPWAYFLMGTSFITHLLIITAFVLIPVNPITLLSFLLIVFTDYQTTKSNLDSSHLEYLKNYFILFEIFYILYTVLFAVYFALPLKVVWKNRRL